MQNARCGNHDRAAEAKDISGPKLFDELTPTSTAVPPEVDGARLACGQQVAGDGGVSRMLRLS